MKKLKFNKVAIIGVGLIGGSIGMAVRKNGLAREVVGITAHKSSAIKARRMGAIDRTPRDLGDAVRGSDLIIIATPVCDIAVYAKKMERFLKRGAIVIDVGSAKANITKEIERVLAPDIYYVGTHPMAGSQLKGVSAASAGLFKDSVCVLTVSQKTDKNAFNTVKRLWNILGADVVKMPALLHDRLVGMISHLPHIVAASLVDCVDYDSFSLAASGFRDTTRIAASDPAIWRDVCLDNKAQILKSIERFTASLNKFKTAVKKGDAKRLLSLFKNVQAKRNKLK